MSILLTGATGFLGMELLLRYLEAGDRKVYVLVRAAGEEHAAERLRATLASLFGDEGAHAERVAPVAGDITQPGLGLSPARRAELAAEVTGVVHSAASVSFDLPLAESRLINVEGTRNVLELARKCEELNRFSYVSTAYVAGSHRGGFCEDDLDVGQEFRNPYERTKYEAELLVRLHSDELPVQVFRPSIIVGDRASGWTPAFNVLYWPLKAYQRGLYTAIPARRDAPVDVVPVDYVADAIAELTARPGPAGATYHLTASEHASTVGEILGLASGYFGRRPPRMLSPSLYRHGIHPALLVTSDAKRRRMLRRSEVFFPYFSMQVEFESPKTRARLAPAGIEPSPLRDYFGRLLDFALGCDWGRLGTPRSRSPEPLLGIPN